MTVGWVFFGIVRPAIIAGLGWVAVLANERHLRKQAEREAKPAE